MIYTLVGIWEFLLIWVWLNTAHYRWTESILDFLSDVLWGDA